ncbi:nucleotidyltransferase [Fusibacter ferrireducens]|uniref:tRNA(Met) cytidine acetate ligase n=1 Tax=Fusibacter ferrireducens TaxID=2785058 RepID=A0ABR9ZMM9_9FIRM|nr:nucleotidyltransferase [Fusibacter ferrireducens]MBF4691694.1 nucleotidyltransferase [Fusibacter ferrireducens]
MKIIAIIAEYNPFHNGHMYQLQKSVQETGANGVIAIMSGNFVQRGHPAFWDKWTRTELALAAGVNLIIELPVFFATASAEQFGFGAIKLLNDTHVVSQLCFGTENTDQHAFDKIASILANEPPEFKQALASALAQGLSFPAAREKALKAILDIDTIPNTSNSILGLEYFKAIKKLNSPIEPHLTKRVGSGYNDEKLNIGFSSATAIRKAYFDALKKQESFDFGDVLPQNCNDYLRQVQPAALSVEHFQDILLYKLRSSSTLELSKFREVTEGLEYKIKAHALKARTYNELIEGLKSKRYTATKISRMLNNILLNIPKDFDGTKHLNYLRVLGFDPTGQKILKMIKDNSELNLITNLNHIPYSLKENPLLSMDCLATDVYALGYKSTPDRQGAKDLTKSIIIRRP